VMKNDETVGAVGNKLIYPDRTIQHGGVVIINDKKNSDPLLAQNIFVGQNKDFPDANQMREYQAVTAACMLTSKKYFKQAAGFDEQFWNGYEDVDFCFKIREAGAKIVYQPASEVVHYESKSGTERFAKVGENIRLLHQRWLNKIGVDFIIDEAGDVQQTSNVQIKPYPSSARSAGERTDISGLVSIVMLTCNALDYTKKCIQSIQKSTQQAHEIIFVDNASTDGTQKYLENQVKQNANYKLIKNKTNIGFAAGNNQAVKEANGQYVLFLNNDVLVSNGWLFDMVSAIEKDEAIGMIGPLTNSISGLQRLDNIPYKDNAGFDDFAAQIRAGNKGRITPRRRIAGFAILMHKELYQQVKGFDETFGLGNFEDDDLCLKVKEAGYAIMVHEGTFIHHFGSQSFKANGIDLIQSLDEKGTIFKENWPDIDYEELLEINNPLHVVHPKMVNEATELLENGETEKASDIFSAILDENPINGEALMGMALALRLDGQGNHAVQFLNTAFKHFPDNLLIPNQLGMIAFEMGDLDLAKSHFATAIQMNPSFLEAKRNYGQVLIDSGDYENGVTAFTKILEKHPD
ncbi:MAG: glycosyltransferase, partial [Gammaproteobacteria bacterium]|nr:glycosyltransferase [Gammaproteobacteria bacterium]